MNKEFRVWDDFQKKMSYGDKGKDLTVAFTNGKLSEVTLDDNEKSCGWSAVPIDLERGNRYFTQQWTGLTDSTGKKIFEGDIIKWDDASEGKYWRVAQVIWNLEGCWAFRTIPKQCIGAMTNYSHDFRMGSFIYSPNPSAHGNVLEIIGNIFGNPELLK